MEAFVVFRKMLEIYLKAFMGVLDNRCCQKDAIPFICLDV
jgi:hypothetical protein